MPWPDSYVCPECEETVRRPQGANVWGCVCAKGPTCRCRMLDAVKCQRCGKLDGFPRHTVPPLDREDVAKSVLIAPDLTPFEREFTLKDINEKRRAYCDRCLHEQFFLRYTDIDITCLLCGASGMRGCTLAHVPPMARPSVPTPAVPEPVVDDDDEPVMTHYRLKE